MLMFSILLILFHYCLCDWLLIYSGLYDETFNANEWQF